MQVINVPRNMKALDDPGAGNGQSAGGIYIGTDTYVVPMFADAAPGAWAYWGPAAGWYLYSSPATDATLVDQARQVAAEAKSGAAAGIDFANPGNTRFMPYNWATYYIAQNEGRRWVPLGSVGSFWAPAAGAYGAYFGLSPDDPIMVMSAGYDVSVGPVVPGPAELFGWPSVQVTYHRTGAVPSPRGPANSLDPTTIPGWGEIVAATAAMTGMASLINAAHQAGVPIPPHATYVVDEPGQVFVNDPHGMDSVLVGAGATVAGSPSGSVIPVSANGTPAAVVTDTGLAVIPTVAPAAPGPLDSVLSIFGLPAPGAPPAAGGTNWLPILALAGLVILATRK